MPVIEKLCIMESNIRSHFLYFQKKFQHRSVQRPKILTKFYSKICKDGWFKAYKHIQLQAVRRLKEISLPQGKFCPISFSPRKHIFVYCMFGSIFYSLMYTYWRSKQTIINLIPNSPKCETIYYTTHGNW